MKKHYKTSLIFGIIVASLLAIYFLLINFVMPEYYQARLPAGFNGTISKTRLFSVELRDVSIAQIKAEQIILGFWPGSAVPHSITADGIDFELSWDGNELNINQQPPETIIAQLSSFGKLPNIKIINSQCSLTGLNRQIVLPNFALSFSSQNNHNFSGELHSLDNKRPFKLKFHRNLKANTLMLAPEGNVELKELVQLAIKTKIIKPVADLVLKGEITLGGEISFNTADRTIVSSSLTGTTNQSEIACGSFKIIQDSPAKIILNTSDGCLLVEASNLQLTAPTPLELEHLEIKLPETKNPIVNISGIAKITPKHQEWLQRSGLKFISERMIKTDFNGSYNTLNGVWNAWSDVDAEQHEYVLKYNNLTIDFILSKLAFHANGLGNKINQLTINSTAKNILALSENCRANFKDVIFELKRDVNAVSTGILKLREGVFNDFSVKDLDVKFTSETEINADIVAQNIAIPFKNTILEFSQPSFNANLKLVQGQLKSATFKGQAPKATSKVLGVSNIETSVSLEDGILDGYLNFKDGSMNLNDARLFTPDGKFYFKEHNVSLQTAELWYFGNQFNGKFDGVKLDTTPSDSKCKITLNIKESNATVNGVALKSGNITASSKTAPSADPTTWRPTMLEIDQLELNSKIMTTVIPKLIFDNNTLRFSNASLTLGAVALRNISFTQPMDSNGSLHVARFSLNNQEQGTLNVVTTLKDSVLKFNGKHLIPMLNNAELSYSGILDNAGLKLDYQIPSLIIKRDTSAGFLNSAWNDLQFSGRGALSGQIVANHEKYSCSSSVMLDDAALAGKDWAVNALRGNIEFSDLVTLNTLPHQKLIFGNVVIDGVELNDGTTIFQLVGTNEIMLEHAVFSCLGGRLNLAMPIQFNPETDTVTLEFFAEGLDTGALLRRLGIPKAAGQSRLNGRLPISVSNRRLVPVNAILNSSNGTLQLGGLEKFNAGASPELLVNGQLPFIQAVLADFIYRELKITANGNTVKIDAGGRPATKVPFRWNEASKRFVKTNLNDGIGGELQITTEINNR